jgi:hypothetical protein
LRKPLIPDIISYIIFSFFFIIGIINLTFPRFLWNLNEGWKATKEPPKSYFILRRLTGLFLMSIPIAWLCFVYYMGRRIIR